MSKIINLGVAAVAAMEGATKLRIRVIADETSQLSLQIRPTNRSNLTNLPKNEVLADIRTRSDGRGIRATIPNTFGKHTLDLIADAVAETPSLFALDRAKHGWMTLTERPVAALGKEVLTGSLSDK